MKKYLNAWSMDRGFHYETVAATEDSMISLAEEIARPTHPSFDKMILPGESWTQEGVTYTNVGPGTVHVSYGDKK